MPPETTTNPPAQTGNEPGNNEGGGTGTQTGATATGTPAAATTAASRTLDVKTFTQDELNAIIEKRLAAQRAQFDKQKADEKLAADGEWQKLAVSHEARVKELEDSLATKERDLLATKIAAKHQLPETLAARLVGDDAETLEADAVALAKLIATPPAATAPPSSGSPANAARPNTGAPVKREDLKGMDWQQIVKLKDEGKLNHLIEGQPR